MKKRELIKIIRDDLSEHVFSKEEIAYFAWLCAIRTLPYLNVGKDKTSFWVDEEGTVLLYDLFNSLDMCVANIKANIPIPDVLVNQKRYYDAVTNVLSTAATLTL